MFGPILSVFIYDDNDAKKLCLCAVKINGLIRAIFTESIDNMMLSEKYSR